MLSLRKKDAELEELFSRNYERLLGWSVQLTGGDRPAAEDLLHDVYILLSLHQPDPATIGNIEGYLYTMLRNLRLSQLRRAARAPMQQLSIIEFDSAEAGLRANSAHDRMQVQDDLRRVCRHVCARKEKAKAACVLILRFFHGYYPSEVARVLRTTRQAVDVRLREARSEARLVLENPRTLGLHQDRKAEAVFPAKFIRPDEDFLNELRQAIFQSRRGVCLTAQQLKDLYLPAGEILPTQEQLAHIISCRDCLDRANSLLGIPALSERNPVDSASRESGKKGGRGGGSPGGGAPTMRKLKRWRREAGEVFEHKPQELCVSVNGHVRGTQRVTSQLSELNLVVDSAESLSFVEVISEQEVRLLMLSVEVPPAGAGQQIAGVALSDGRWLEMSLRFSSPGPTLRCLYQDPTFNDASEPLWERAEAAGPSITPARAASAEDNSCGRVGTLRALLAFFARKFFGKRFLLRPLTLTAALAAILVTTLLFMRTPGPPGVSAAGLLRRSAAADEGAGGVDAFLHRTISFEERREAGGNLIARRRVEVWRSTGRGLTVRRLYDERGLILAGEWSDADGTSTVYRRPGQRPQPAPPSAGAPAWTDDSVWQLEPSARDFSALVGHAESVKVTEGDGSYLLTYEGGQTQPAQEEVVAATLVLRRESLHATEQTLVVRRGGEQRQFRLTEVSYERRQKDSVPASVFDPDPELLKAGGIRVERPEPDTPPQASAEDKPSAAAATPAATAALEVQVLGLLSRAGADLGEQVSVTRTPQGWLRVQAMVETERRKAELLEALKPVATNPAVRVEVVTAAEAARQSAQGQQPAPSVVRQVEPADEKMATDGDLRRYFSEHGTAGGDEIESEIVRFAVRESAHSRAALQHAWALKRLVSRFSPEELRSLDAEAKARWLSMVGAHAEAVRREMAGLRQELQRVFSTSGKGATEAGVVRLTINSEADLSEGAERILALCSEVDPVVHSAFTISTERPTPSAIKSLTFWRALSEAEALAEQVGRAARKLTPAPGAQPRANPSPPPSSTWPPHAQAPRPDGGRG